MFSKEVEMTTSQSTGMVQPNAITIDQHEAARLSGLSAKTLERRAAEGQPVGRIKIGRRVLYVKSQLESWLTSQHHQQ
jgi:predicted DNA-binding transcriptional regulator AlpA